ncbi:hypothetical protein [Undibacterium crateris]|uniref:hypothetical protein n=1 Tax=Undibacterium crateris TaxID=2528175 RepID=UPI0013899709|nr:hypothetical protein [Undibacterium crateris]NDI85724.1 hypothetical protein [Undibacterium crateris]
MIDGMDSILNMFQRGVMPLWEVVSWTVKRLAEGGCEKAEFENLPDWLKEAVIADIVQFEKDGEWYVIGSNSPGEDYAPYAVAVRAQILEPLGLIAPHWDADR